MLLDKEVLKLQTWAFRISQDYFYFFIFLKNFLQFGFQKQAYHFMFSLWMCENYRQIYNGLKGVNEYLGSKGRHTTTFNFSYYSF